MFLGDKYRSQKITSKMLILWTCMVISALICYDIYNQKNEFILFGPSESLRFLKIQIHTWPRYIVLVCFLICTQALKVFADETISPFIINEIMQHTTETHIIDNFSYLELQCVCQSYYIFSAMSKLVAIFTSLTQIDLILALILTDIIISVNTTNFFLKMKGLSFYDKKNDITIHESSLLYQRF